MEYLAHRTQEGDRAQALLAHLTGTAERAGEFAAVFDAQEIAYRCGLLHDIGKYSKKFQRRIRGSEETVDHATAGMLEAVKLGDLSAAFCIAGHHGGLPDYGRPKYDSASDTTFSGKRKRRPGAELEDYSAFTEEVAIPDTKIPKEFTAEHRSLFFFIHMLYSCLVDADWLDTEAFMDGPRGAFGQPLEALLAYLEAHITRWWDAKNELNRRRSVILRAALEGGALSRGLFSMTVPTGGGKTTASMAFALKHALAHGLRRVIYVIPYTSIIEQTQTVFEEIFGTENVVAHYANVEFSTEENGDLHDRRRLATENWDAPIILTTAVQFFESLFANKPSRCRKLHNIADSVLIFDEAQMLPPPYLSPCVWAISRLVAQYGCSAVLCTATQPALEPLFDVHLPGYPVRELCPDVAGMYDFFRRVRYEMAGTLSCETVAQRMSAEAQVLCVVSTKRQARTVFALLPKEGRFHLSTSMTPAHRRKVLTEIRRRLKCGALCRVVSTSLIEAGVDVDFPTVWRALAGLDSMIQAAGRCNREGKCPPEESVVYLFEPEEGVPDFIKQNVAAAKHVMRDCDDIASPDAIRAYFEFLHFTLRDATAMDKKRVLADIDAGGMPFASVAERFHLIEDGGCTIYIPHDGYETLVRELLENGPRRDLLRRLGSCTTSVSRSYFGRLIQLDAVEQISEDAGVLQDAQLYDDETGLAPEVHGGVGYFT